MHNKIESLQSWRAIMAIMIFILHVCPEKIPLLAGGNEALSFFIILSGFVLGMSDREYLVSVNSVGKFVRKRLKKIFPLHIFMIFLCVLLELITFMANHDFSNFLNLMGKVVIDSAMLQAFVPNENWYFSLNGVSWYLSAMMYFYIIFIPIYQALKKVSMNFLKNLLWGGIALCNCNCSSARK